LSITKRQFAADDEENDDAEQQQPAGLRPTPLPRRWIVGTVDGSISVIGMKPPSATSTEKSGSNHPSKSFSPENSAVSIGLLVSRPPMQTSSSSNSGGGAATRRPLTRRSHPGSLPLHQEPISSVSVAPSSGRPQVLVVSTDIAQKLIFSVITPSFGKRQQQQQVPSKHRAGDGDSVEHMFELFPRDAIPRPASTQKQILKVLLRIALVVLLIGCLITAGLLLQSAIGLILS
jgi:hypothetical protein